VLRAVYPEPGIAPALIYIAANGPEATLWTGQRAGIAEAVARYDPLTHYVVIEGIVDLDSGSLRSADAFLIAYPHPAPSQKGTNKE
jgi:hypothetical protein